MKVYRLVRGVPYVRFDPTSIPSAVERELGTCFATLSIDDPLELAAPIFRHDLPFQFAWWGEKFFGADGQVATLRSPPVTINTFKQASLVGQDGVVFLTTGTELDYHLAFTQPFRTGSLIRDIDGALWRPDLAGMFCEGRFLLGHTPAWSNYAHWLTDTMPIWVFYSLHLKQQGIKLVVPPLLDVQSELLQLLGIEEVDLLRTNGETKLFEELLVPSMISVSEPPSLFRSAALHLIAQITATRPITSHRRLFFSRRDVTNRRLLNEGVVEELLQSFGFELIRCSELSFVDQVTIAAEAEIVVGCHGAAMANTIFCSPGCKIIELFPEYCIQPAFRAIATLCSCPYGYIVGTSFDRENSRRDQNSWDADFVIDVSALKQALVLTLDAKG